MDQDSTGSCTFDPPAWRFQCKRCEFGADNFDLLRYHWAGAHTNQLQQIDRGLRALDDKIASALEPATEGMIGTSGVWITPPDQALDLAVAQRWQEIQLRKGVRK